MIRKIRKEKENQFLDRMLSEVKEDVHLSGPLTAAIIFYQVINDKKCFKDYEMADVEEPTYARYGVKFMQFYQNAKKDGMLVPGFTNVLYPDEFYEIVSLKELYKILWQLRHPEVQNMDVVALAATLEMRSLSSYWLAQQLKVSKQIISQWILQDRPISKTKYEILSEVLDIDIDEFSTKGTDYELDPNDFIDYKKK